MGGDVAFSITEEEDGVTVLVDGELFTRYLVKSGPRPVLWPLIGPTGKEMTRAYSVEKGRSHEEQDHIHHRSVWVGYEGLNKNDFWHEFEADRTRPFPLGQTKHKKFKTLSAKNSTATIISENDWLGGNGEVVCSDIRTIVFGANHDQRWFDYDIELIASNGKLEIGDSKEGFFAIRVASTMRVDEGLGGKIITSRGKTNADAWSHQAEWVDYHGPVDDETVGIAILSHPKSYCPLPRWHVRNYGLFGVNPFGELAFTDPKTDVTKRPLRITLEEDESLKFRYRVILHRGDEKEAKIAEQFVEYAEE